MISKRFIGDGTAFFTRMPSKPSGLLMLALLETQIATIVDRKTAKLSSLKGIAAFEAAGFAAETIDRSRQALTGRLPYQS